MKAQYLEGEVFQQLLQGRNEVTLADFLNGTNNLELYYFINSIDMVDPFALIQITLMHCIYADIAWFAIRSGLATLTDTGRLGSGLLEVMSLPGVGGGLSQVIQVTHRD